MARDLSVVIEPAAKNGEGFDMVIVKTSVIALHVAKSLSQTLTLAESLSSHLPRNFYPKHRPRPSQELSHFLQVGSPLLSGFSASSRSDSR